MQYNISLVMFQRNVPPPSSGLKNKPSKQPARVLLGILSKPVDDSDIFP
jgi:hypothetical protein